FGRQRRQLVVLTLRPAIFDRHVLALDIAGFAQSFAECCQQTCHRLRRISMDISDDWNSRLLRPRRERPRGRAAEQRDELASPYSITSSAVASSAGGTVRPSALAVLRLINSATFVASSTGRSAGFSPWRIRVDRGHNPW